MIAFQSGGIIEKTAAEIKAAMQSRAGENHTLSEIPENVPTAVCRNGTFVGKKEGDVLVFRGISFAEPPIGPLRWKDPVPAENRQDIREEYYYGKARSRRNGRLKWVPVNEALKNDI